MADPEDREPRPAPPPAEGSAYETTTEEAPEGRAAEVHIGVYRVLGLLGAGGMGDVFLAHDSRLRRRVAIKRVRRDAAPSERARARLRREAAAAATLSHPAVVHIYDILEEPDGDAIVMEYVEGRTLASLRAEGPLPVRQAIGLGRQIAEGLAAAHALGLIHRDLKTQNVMVTPAGLAKILDFGLAKQLTPSPDDDSLTADGAVIGTFRSMSPEQAEGRAVDARSDLFSLGVLLYEIGTGRAPFKGDSPAQTLLQVIGEQPLAAGELNPELPLPLAQVIHQLLEKDPDRRPQSAAEVAARLRELERLLDPAGPGLIPPSATHTAAGAGQPTARRWFLRWPVLTAVALLAAAVAVILSVRPWKPGRPTSVLVQEPRVTSQPSDERTEWARFTLKEAVFRTLAELEGIEPMGVGSEDVASSTLSVRDAARAMGADEVVASTIACQGPYCRISLRRYRSDGERLLRDSGSFDVPAEREESLALADAVTIQVGLAFREHAPRSAGARLAARGADYQRYLEFLRRREAGQVLGPAELDGLEQINHSSPGLTEAYALAANTARGLSDFQRAERILQEADARHPGDPRLAYERVLLELDAGKTAEAEKALAALEKCAPGDIRVWQARAYLLSRQGRLREAAEARRRLLQEQRSWKNLWRLADIEMDLGDTPAARQHLAELLELSPGNPRGLAKMAVLEWLMGDPRKAVRIYQDQLKESRENLGNLGWSLLLAGEYEASADAYRRTLALDSDYPLGRLNLGVAQEGAGDRDGARRTYRELVESLTDTERHEALTVPQQLIKAQALARLGERMDAVRLTIEALAKGDQDPQLIFQAAIIYALCGDQSSAIFHATEARKRGLSPAWFGIPGFESIREAPGFRELRKPA